MLYLQNIGGTRWNTLYFFLFGRVYQTNCYVYLISPGPEGVVYFTPIIFTWLARVECGGLKAGGPGHCWRSRCFLNFSLWMNCCPQSFGPPQTILLEVFPISLRLTKALSANSWDFLNIICFYKLLNCQLQNFLRLSAFQWSSISMEKILYINFSKSYWTCTLGCSIPNT